MTSIRWSDFNSLTTLDEMVARVNTSLTNALLVDTARELAMNVAPARDYWRQAVGLKNWLERVFRFVDDPTGKEKLRNPDEMIREYGRLGFITGDCDEVAILGAAMAKAIGLEAVFTIYAFPDPASGVDFYSHVFATVLTPDGRSLSLDVTKPAGSVPSPTRELTVEV